MKIIGIGTDIVEIARIERLVTQHPQRFAERVLHPNELISFSQQTNPVAWLAKRFATKEAVAKALGTGIGKEAQLQDIETFKDEKGKPHLRLHGVTLQTAQHLGVLQLDLSLSDERAHAIAFVILSGAE